MLDPAKDLEVSWLLKDRVSHTNETTIPPQGPCLTYATIPPH